MNELFPEHLSHTMAHRFDRLGDEAEGEDWRSGDRTKADAEDTRAVIAAYIDAEVSGLTDDEATEAVTIAERSYRRARAARV